jgi:hypothetical protein
MEEKKKKKPVNGKAKGNAFEGLIAKKLSVALAPLNFKRSPGSGAAVGGKNFEIFGAMYGEEALKLFVADVVPLNEKQSKVKFKYSLECKFYKTQDNFTQLAQGSANVFKWFNESVIDSAKINKMPLLIFKWNNTSIFVAIKETDTLLESALTIKNKDVSLKIFEFETLIKNKEFWIEHDE